MRTEIVCGVPIHLVLAQQGLPAERLLGALAR